MPFLATLNSSFELSSAHTKIFRSGRVERIVHKIEYTSAPMLQPSTAILKVEPLTFSLIRRRISSSAGRFRKKNVPKYCWRAAWRQTKLCMHAPVCADRIEIAHARGKKLPDPPIKAQIKPDKGLSEVCPRCRTS